MGIVNVTPDSFSDGGRYAARDAAVKHALRLIADGADIIDIGGESTRPGAQAVSKDQELERVVPIIEAVRSLTDTLISIDTYKPKVMQEAIAAGANLVNDVRALQTEGAVETVATLGVPVCLMHMQGSPETMQNQPSYSNAVAQVIDFLQQRVSTCIEAGIAPESIIVDPGIGFGKTLEHNLQLLKCIDDIKQQCGSEVLIGVSRKSMIGSLLDRAVEERMAGSVGLAVQAVLNGAAIVRVHDVRETVDAIRCVEAVQSVRLPQ